MKRQLDESACFDITRYACNIHPVLAGYWADENHPVKGVLLERISTLANDSELQSVVAHVKRGERWAQKEWHLATDLLIAHLGGPPMAQAFEKRDETHDQILELWADGINKSQIALAVGVSRRTVGRVITQKGGGEGQVVPRYGSDACPPVGGAL